MYLQGDLLGELVLPAGDLQSQGPQAWQDRLREINPGNAFQGEVETQIKYVLRNSQARYAKAGPLQDLDVLRKKVQAGVSFVITQLFFDNELYFDFVDKARAAGVEVPIIPGIMPVTNFAQIKRFTEMCGASIPPDFERELAARAEDPDAVKDLGVAYATLQCYELLGRKS